MPTPIRTTKRERTVIRAKLVKLDRVAQRGLDGVPRATPEAFGRRWLLERVLLERFLNRP